MRYRFQPWQLAAIVILICIGTLLGFYIYRSQAPASPAQMASYLPLTDGALIYIDVNAIRDSGLLNLIAGTKAAEEIEYKKFVDDTHFDYRQDLQAVAALFKGDQVFMILRGHFDWKALMSYVSRQGGTCVNSFCTIQGSQPDRRISFYPIRSKLIALAVSRDGWAAYQISKRSGQLPIKPPAEPVWAVLTGPALRGLAALPAGTKSYASALESADRVIFTLGQQGDHLQLAMRVFCQNPEKASALVSNLESTTDTLRKWLTREHKQPNPNDLSGVLTAGSFRRDDRQVFGAWPVQRSFVEAIAGGNYQ